MTTSSEVLKKISSIQYQVYFQSKFVDELFDSGSKATAMTPSFVSKWAIVSQSINVDIYKIAGTYL